MADLITGDGLQRISPNPQSGHWIKRRGGGGGGPVYDQTRVRFDGSTRMRSTQSAAGAGATDKPGFTFNYWISGATFATAKALSDLAQNIAGPILRASFQLVSGRPTLVILNPPNTAVATLTATDALTPNDLHHIYMRGTMGGDGEIWVDGTLQAQQALPAGDLDYSLIDRFSCGASWTNSQLYVGCLGDFMWFDTDQGSVAPFWNGGVPPNPGADGSAITGTQPQVFMGNGMSVADWNAANGTNLGSWAGYDLTAGTGSGAGTLLDC